MNNSSRPGKNPLILVICLITLVLAVAWSAAAATAAELQNRGAVPDLQQDGRPTVPSLGENEGRLPTPQPTPLPDQSVDLHFDLAAPNRIVFHAATPVQLCKAGDGLQVFFIGSGGTTRPGPWLPPFSELAELYPEGDPVSLFSDSNPLTGKPANIDYLPSAQRIRVATFYADTDYDINKPYIFHFGPEHDITHDAW